MTIPVTVRAAIMMILGGTGYVLAGALTRHLSGEYSPSQLVFFRSVVAVMFLAPMFMRAGVDGFKTRQIGMHGVRVILTYLGILCWFYSVSVIPVSDYFALLFTQPLFTIAAAVLLLGEKAGTKTWIATSVGFFGALVILRPGFQEVSLGMLAALGAGLCYAGVNTCIKFLSRQDSTVVIVAYANTLILPVALVPALFDWTTPSWADLPLIAGIGVFATLGQIGLTRAIQMADARVVQPFDFFRLPIAAAVGWLAFQEVSDLWTWVGALIIFAAGTYVLRTEARLAKH